MSQERLQKVIANRGAVSRRRAEKLIELGRVKVNGEVVRTLGLKIDPQAKIEIDNRPVLSTQDKYYFLFNKPRFVVTTMYDPKGRKIVADYFKTINARVYPVGRLDYDVSGVLLMTNDGDFANFVMHPRYQFKKSYQALVEGRIKTKTLKQLLQGVKIDEDYKAQALDAQLINYKEETDLSVIELTIAEGRKHHVKKMLEAAQIKLVKLKRTQIEFLTDQGLKVGQYRALTPHEVKQFYGLYHSKAKNKLSK